MATPIPDGGQAAVPLDRRSQRGLDWLNFFVANLQTAFGPFIAVYLTSAHWTQGQIGLVLTVGSVTAMASQVPAGAAVDMLRNKHAAASVAIIAIVLSCLLLAVFPDRLPVTAAEILHGFASCMLNPAIAAITLSVVAAGVAAQDAEQRAAAAHASAVLRSAEIGTHDTPGTMPAPPHPSAPAQPGERAEDAAGGLDMHGQAGNRAQALRVDAASNRLVPGERAFGETARPGADPRGSDEALRAGAASDRPMPEIGETARPGADSHRSDEALRADAGSDRLVPGEGTVGETARPGADPHGNDEAQRAHAAPHRPGGCEGQSPAGSARGPADRPDGTLPAPDGAAIEAAALMGEDVQARTRAEAAAPANAALGERFGRNASFGSIGNAIAAGLMGGVGYLVSARATFFLGALLALPGLLALRMIARVPEPAATPGGGTALSGENIAAKPKGGVRALLHDRRLAAFAVCVVLYHLGNGGMLTLAAGEVTRNAGHLAELVIAACILLPQILGAYLSPKIGRWAGIYGRRPVMMIAFAAVPLRGLLLAVSPSPVLIVAVQMLDAVSSAAFGVMMPLVAADLSRGTGRFNLCMGLLGLAMGIGASFSTSLAGLVADRSLRAGFLVLATSGALCVAAVALLFRETAPGPLRTLRRARA